MRWVLLLVFVTVATAANQNILLLLGFSTPSHMRRFWPLIEELQFRGHNLIVAAPYVTPPKDFPNVTFLELTQNKAILNNALNQMFQKSRKDLFKLCKFSAKISMQLTEGLYKDPNVLNLLKNGPEIDILLTDPFYSDFVLWVAYILNVPVIQLNTSPLDPWNAHMVKLPMDKNFEPYALAIEHYSYPQHWRYSVAMAIGNVIDIAVETVLYEMELTLLPLKKHEMYPSLQDIRFSFVYLLIFNSDSIFDGPVILPSNVVRVGPFHFQKANALPQDLQKFLKKSIQQETDETDEIDETDETDEIDETDKTDSSQENYLKIASMESDTKARVSFLDNVQNLSMSSCDKHVGNSDIENISKSRSEKPHENADSTVFPGFTSDNHGFIAIDMGSLTNTSYLPSGLFHHIISDLVQMEHKVIWITNDQPESKYFNIRFVEKSFQKDILGHPYLKLLVTDCDLLILQEALYNAIPIVGIPFYTSQAKYCYRAEQLGFGVVGQPRSISRSITKILSNDTFKIMALKYSSMFRAEINDSLDTVVHWIEHSIKRKPVTPHPPLSGPSYKRKFYWVLVRVAGSVREVLIALILAFFMCKFFDFV